MIDPGTGQLVNAPLDLPTQEAFSALAPAPIDVPEMFPVVEQIAPLGQPAVDGGPVQFAVQFSKPVFGMSATDFTLALSGTASGTISAVSGGGANYVVTVDGVSGDGGAGAQSCGR